MDLKLLKSSILVLIISSNVYAQLEYNYDLQFGASTFTAYERVSAITRDNSNNIFFSGSYYNSNPANYNPTGTTNLTVNSGNTGIFITKFNESGSTEWIIDLNGAMTGAHCYAHEMKTDPSGNLYVWGVYQGTTDLDPSGGLAIITSKNGGTHQSRFIVKYSSSGSLLWYHSFDTGNTASRIGGNIELKSNGNILLIGTTLASVDFDPTPSVSAQTQHGNMDGFILELDETGAFIDINQFGGGLSDYAYSSDYNTATGELVIYGQKFGTSSGTQFEFNGGGTNYLVGTNGAFIVKYDASGAVLEALELTGDITPHEVITDNNGNICISGSYTGSIDLDPTSGTYNLTNTVAQPFLFLAKLSNSSNAPLWVNEINSTGGINGVLNLDKTGSDELIFSISAPSGFNYVATNGTTSSTISNGPATIFTKIDNLGNLVWQNQLNSTRAWSTFADGNSFYAGLIVFTSTDLDFSTNDEIVNSIDGLYDIVKYSECLPIDETVISNGLILTASQSGGTYQWVDCNNSNAPIAGATSQTFTPSNGGDYACEITIGSCTYLSDCANSVVSTTTLNPDFFSVYPNPSHGKVQIKPGQSLELLTVSDLMGHEIEKHADVHNQIELNLKPGVYIIRAFDNASRMHTQQVIIL